MESEKIVIKMIKTARPDLSMFFKIDPATIAEEGKEYSATSNQYGAVCVICANGEGLGVRPGEFEFIEAPEWLLEIHKKIKVKRKFKCEAQIIITERFEADSYEEAEELMNDYMAENYGELEWVVSVYERSENIG